MPKLAGIPFQAFEKVTQVPRGWKTPNMHILMIAANRKAKTITIEPKE